MNSPSSPENSGRLCASAAIEEAAIGWLTERDDGFSLARKREFARWLHADPRHAAAVARLEQTLGLLGEIQEFRVDLNAAFDRAASVVPFPATTAGPAARTHQLRRRLLAWSGVAAALVLGVLTTWRTLQPPGETRYATSSASYQRARLDDGSTLELNARSSVRVRFSAAERRVKLEAGEAHFAVAHETARPFVVSAGSVSVRAVGTAFTVRLTAAGDVEVTVVEGKVRVGQGGAGVSAAAEAALVAAGERLLWPIHAPPPGVKKIDPAALRESLGWQRRLADFSDAPLADVIARFNARNRVQLILADAAIGQRRIGGTFALDEAEAFVRLLERDGEIVAEHRGDSEILLRGAR